MAYKLKCIVCDGSFENRVAHAVTCSVDCRKTLFKKHSLKSRIKKEENGFSKQCETCSNSFTSSRVEARYCSKKCTKPNLGNLKSLESINCKNCNNIFQVKKGNKDNKIFCSRKCSGEFQKHDDIILNCEYCKKDFQIDYIRREHRFCSRSCTTRFGNENRDKETVAKKISETKKSNFKNGEIHSWFGRKHSELSKQKSSKTRIENGKSFGVNNPMFGKFHSEKSKEQMSLSRTKNILDDKYDEWFNKGIYFSNKMQTEMIYRSSWEKNIFEILDKDELVISFESEPCYIPYTHEGNRHYIPDLLIEYTSGIKKLVEIKPEFFTDYEINIAKFAAGRKYCEEKGIIFEVWTEKEIELL